MPFLNYHDKNKFVTNINPDDFKTAIIERNENYCKSYNCGEYTLDKWNERVKSPEMQHYFDVIKSITKGE